MPKVPTQAARALVAALALAGCASRGSAGGGSGTGGGGGGATPTGGFNGGAGPSGGDAGGRPNGTGGAGGTSGSPGEGGVPGSGGAAGSASSSGGAGAGGKTTGTGGRVTDGGAGDARTAPDGGCAGLFCEDFEKGIIDPAIWDVKVDGTQAAPDVVSQSALVAHGKYAAHFHARPNVVSYDFIITRNAPAALKGHHFGRASFMVTPMPPTNHTEYLFAGTTGFPKLKYLEVASAAPLVWQLTYVDLASSATGEDYHSGGKVPVGKWFCLEWEFNDAPDRAAVYVDGTQAFAQNTFTFNNATSGLVGGFAAFGFGYYAWHPVMYDFDVYYDDIVLDTKRVGCLD
ncbi:MAG TPA: hypothetical protein VHM31_23545 [Polyangia bacterium]|nr:hypothetical protein [Polyangia bacterium]